MGFLGELAPPASRLRLPNGAWHTASGRILGVSIAEPPKGIPIINVTGKRRRVPQPPHPNIPCTKSRKANGLMKENTSILPARFNRDKDEWNFIDNSGTNIKADILTFVTYNTWFDDFHFEKRFRAITEILRESNADIIALQEITNASLEIFLQKDWVKNNYFISDISGSTLTSTDRRKNFNYVVILLSRIPIKSLNLHPLTSGQGRHVLIAEFEINGQKCLIGTTHLESVGRRLERPPEEIRRREELHPVQLMECFSLLNDSNHSVLMGDFNFSWEENSNIASSYLDFWGTLRSNDPGYTARFRSGNPARIDRILCRSADQSWKPTKIDRIGMKPISSDSPDIFPSDHFALIGVLERCINT